MLCNDFEDRLTDYLDDVLEADMHKTFAEHALRCPVCHETLSEVKNTMQACQAAGGFEPPRELEARILLSTMPETAMTCEDFEEFLTDYLDGFLPASLYHRWQRQNPGFRRKFVHLLAKGSLRGFAAGSIQLSLHSLPRWRRCCSWQYLC